jgi:hypothetical protein
MRREIQIKKTLVSRLPGSNEEEPRLENAACWEGPANNHSNRVEYSHKLPYENGLSRTGEQQRSRVRDFYGAGNTNRPSSRASFGRRDEPSRGEASYRPHDEDSRGRSPPRHDTWRPPPRSREANRPVSPSHAARARWEAAKADAEEKRRYVEMIEVAKASDNGPNHPGPARYDQHDDPSHTNYHHQGQYNGYSRDNGYRAPPEPRKPSPPRTKVTHRLSPSRDEGPPGKKAKRAPRDNPSKSNRHERRAEAARMEMDNAHSRPQNAPVSKRPNPVVPGGLCASTGDGLTDQPQVAQQPSGISKFSGESLPKKPEVSGK